MSRGTFFLYGSFLASSLLLAFLVLPVVGLFVGAGTSGFGDGLSHPLVLPALKLSLFTTTMSLLVVVGLGTFLAWFLVRGHGRFLRALETLVELPMVIPPAVAGVALLLAFGRHGFLSSLFLPEGMALSFTTAAVVMAEVFVSAPFYLKAATSSFRRIDEELFVVARSLGASPARLFFRVAIPLAAPGLVSGAAMSWARALGEFGATLMFAGNLTGETQTLPLAIYTALESDWKAARALSLILIVFAFTLLLVVRAAARRAGA